MDCNHEHFRNHRRFFLLRLMGLVVGGVVIAGIFALAFGWLVMLLWNWLMPSIFSLKAITYWQAFGLTVLAKLVFSGVQHPLQNHLRYHHHGGPSSWSRTRRDERAPEGDHRNWIYYREYWNERGREDFEDYLKNRKNRGVGEGDDLVNGASRNQ